MSNIRKRLATEADRKELLQLINKVQPHMPWSQEHFDWQYFRSPAGDSKIFILEQSTVIAATCALVPHLFKLHDHEVTAWQLDTLITHPDFRGQGLMHRLIDWFSTEFCSEESPFSFGFPNEHSTRGFTRNGWLTPFRSPVRHNTVFRDDLSSLPGEVSGIEEIEQFEVEIDHLWQRIKNGWPFSVVRDRDHLNWRYQQKPHDRYSYFVKRSGGEIIGLLVMKLYKADQSTTYAHVMDLLTAVDDKQTVADLLARASAFAVEQNADELSCWLLPGHAHEDVYQQYGFILDEELPKWQHIFIPPGHSDSAGNLTGIFQGIMDGRNWHFSMCDSDIY